jgi:phosphoribosylformylglycinamidine synthase PurS subunit
MPEVFRPCTHPSASRGGHLSDSGTGPPRCEHGLPGGDPGHTPVPGTLVGVPRVIVDVVLKPEISDPQGQAVLGALGRLGHDSVRSVRQGKHFVLDVEGTPDEAELREIAETLLANPVIEDVELHLPTD